MVSITQVLRQNGIDPVKLYQEMEEGEWKNFEMELKCPVEKQGRPDPAKPEAIPETVLVWEPRTVRWRATRDRYFMKQEDVEVTAIVQIDPAAPEPPPSSDSRSSSSE